MDVGRGNTFWIRIELELVSFFELKKSNSTNSKSNSGIKFLNSLNSILIPELILSNSNQFKSNSVN